MLSCKFIDFFLKISAHRWKNTLIFASSKRRNHMKVIVDDKIPFIREALAGIADEAVYVPGKDFTPELVKDADALIIRTRTRCDRHLLEGSCVRFIATATIGFDHIDTIYCQEAGITWQNAPGCNSASVAQYMRSSLLLLEQQKGFRLEGKTLGVIGVGNVGTKVAQVGRELGMRVLLNDPPRQEKEGGDLFSPLEQLMEECDVLTFHVPLIRGGAHKTFHLADADFFSHLKRRPVIANTSRGEVIETEALLHALQDGQVSDAVIDVWETNPPSTSTCSTVSSSVRPTSPATRPTARPTPPACRSTPCAASSTSTPATASNCPHPPSRLSRRTIRQKPIWPCTTRGATTKPCASTPNASSNSVATIPCNVNKEPSR